MRIKILVEPTGESSSGGQVERTVRCHNVYPSAGHDLTAAGFATGT
jgi:hypothetical protein